MKVTSITSLQNKLIKDIVILQSKARERRRVSQIVIEGKKEIEVAINSGVNFKKLFFCPQIITLDKVKEIINTQIDNIELFEVSEAVFSKISYRETTGGIVVIAEPVYRKLNDLKITEQSVYIILESVEKPGNLGAICRVADAAKVDGLIICDPHTDIYNPNSIRSSLGCVFSVDVVISDFEDTFEWLQENNIKSFAAELTASEFYQNVDFSGKAALVFGTEATGLTQKWIKNVYKRVKIPMRGVIDSLNVTTSVAILTFEAMRQRKFE